jgi:spore germination protein GerM
MFTIKTIVDRLDKEVIARKRKDKAREGIELANNKTGNNKGDKMNKTTILDQVSMIIFTATSLAMIYLLTNV